MFPNEFYDPVREERLVRDSRPEPAPLPPFAPDYSDVLAFEQTEGHAQRTYMRLVLHAYAANVRCRALARTDQDYGHVMAEELTVYQALMDVGRIEKHQYESLRNIVKFDVREPRVDNDLSVYPMRFPSPDYSPPSAA